MAASSTSPCPRLVDTFHTDLATIQWVVLSYILVTASLMLTIARLGDMRGKKKIYLAGLVLFTIGSLLCGTSPNVYWLIGFRALQGLGATMMWALGTAIITENFPSNERGRALGLIGSIVSIGIAFGPPLGGILIGFTGWRSIFLVNVPIGIATIWVVSRYVPASEPKNKVQRFDLAGALILLLTLGSYAVRHDHGPEPRLWHPRHPGAADRRRGGPGGLRAVRAAPVRAHGGYEPVPQPLVLASTC